MVEDSIEKSVENCEKNFGLNDRQFSLLGLLKMPLYAAIGVKFSGYFYFNVCCVCNFGFCRIITVLLT